MPVAIQQPLPLCFNASDPPVGMNGFQLVIDSVHVDSQTLPFILGASGDGDSATVTLARGLSAQTKHSPVLSTFTRCKQKLRGTYYLLTGHENPPPGAGMKTKAKGK